MSQATAIYCKVAIAPVRAEAADQSEIVTQLLFGEPADILEQTEKWWKIRAYYDNYVGWVDPKQVRKLTKKELTRWLEGLGYQRAMVSRLSTPWGLQYTFKGSFIPYIETDSFLIGNDAFHFLEEREKSTNLNPVTIALEYQNAPYLWGGKTPFGIDCSGLTQMVYRFLDINLPRDASQQIEYGSHVDFEDRLPGDLAFFKNDSGKIIHVGILQDENTIIHASGQVRIDEYDQQGIWHFSKEFYTHHLAEIRRMM
jgi:gamma-D-glutamyl-L-lysine dipeptidyl-peptidase